MRYFIYILVAVFGIWIGKAMAGRRYADAREMREMNKLSQEARGRKIKMNDTKYTNNRI